MLEKLNQPLEWLSEKEIILRLKQYRNQFDGLRPEQIISQPMLIDLFDFIRTLIFRQEIKESAERLNFARKALDLALDRSPDDELLVELLIEWNRTAMRFVPPRAEEYVEYPFFLEIIEATQGKSEHFAIHHWRAHIGLVNNYLNWKAGNGNPDLLPLEDRLALENYLETMEERVRTQLKLWKQAEQYLPYIAVKRTLASYYLQNHQVLEGLSLMVELLDELALFPGYVPPDKADLQMEIASVYLQGNRVEEALPYIRSAHLVYSNSGPGYEPYVEQAASWLEQLGAR
jgi:hypothetical protein